MKRWLAKIVVFLLLGAISTVAIAWASGAWLRLRELDEYAVGRTTPDDSGWFLRAYKRPGAQFVVGYLIADVTDIWHGNEWREDNLSSEEIDWPSVFEHGMDPRPPFIRTLKMNARGWPWPCLYSELSEARSLKPRGYEGPEVRWGVYWQITLSGNTLSVVDNLYAILPWQPIWSGLLLDIATFGGFWASIFMVGRHVRKRWRYLTSRSIIVALITSVLLGVVTTIAVVWYCAIWVDAEYMGGEAADFYGESWDSKGFGNWTVMGNSQPGAVRITSRWSFAGGGGGSEGSPYGPAEDYIPWWGQYLLPTGGRPTFADGSLTIYQRVLYARGWPMLAMWGGIELPQHVEDGVYVGTLGETKHAIVLPRYFKGKFRQDWSRVIPLAPIWPGFLVDTLFYGVIWLFLLLLLAGPGIINRSIRHSRGRCIKCGYDLRGAEHEVCPECGVPTG